jgi:hypothetical protein
VPARERALDLEEAVRRHRGTVGSAAKALKGTEAFSLTAPCCVITDGTALTTSLMGLRGYLPCSVALASAPIDRFLLLRQEHGFDKAFELCATDEEEGEDFCKAWDEAQRDLEDGAVCTLNDLSAMVAQARNGWNEDPKRLLVVAREGSEVVSGLVSVERVG